MIIDEGTNWPFLVIQIVNILLLLSWIVLIVIALLKMRQRLFGELAHVLWVIVIIFVPVFGALAFLITRPGVPEQP
jgi:hypothetical protein